MSDVDAINKVFELFDGLSAVVMAVWVINMLMKQLAEARKQNDDMVDRVNDTNKELLRLVSDRVNQPRGYSLPSTQPRPPELGGSTGL